MVITHYHTLSHIIKFILGTEEERGIKQWRKLVDNAKEASEALKVYDLPWCMPCINRWTWTKYFPLCPTFESCGAAKQKTEDDEVKFELPDGKEEIVVVMDDRNNMHLRHVDPVTSL